MIFRRIKAHIEKENWFAVFIDFLIVVVGVFVGLQVQNWNESRIEKTFEVSYLKRLKTDIQLSIENTNRTTKSYTNNAENLNIVIDSLDSCLLQEDEKDRFVKGIFELGKFELAFFDDTTIEEMKSTGRYGVISNNAILNAIAQIALHIDFQKRIEPQFISLISSHVNYVSRKVRFQVTSINDSDVETITSDKTNYDFNQLCEDPIFIASVSTVRTTMYEILNWNDRINKLMDEAAHQIESELEKLNTK